jgi:hypothetical protein
VTEYLNNSLLFFEKYETIAKSNNIFLQTSGKPSQPLLKRNKRVCIKVNQQKDLSLM